MQERKQFLGNS